MGIRHKPSTHDSARRFQKLLFTTLFSFIFLFSSSISSSAAEPWKPLGKSGAQGPLRVYGGMFTTTVLSQSGANGPVNGPRPSGQASDVLIVNSNAGTGLVQVHLENLLTKLQLTMDLLVINNNGLNHFADHLDNLDQLVHKVFQDNLDLPVHLALLEVLDHKVLPDQLVQVEMVTERSDHKVQLV